MVGVPVDGPHPAPYLYSRVDAGDEGRPYAERLLAEMDRFDVEAALVPVDNEIGAALVRDHPDRFVGEWPAAVDDVDALRRSGARAASFFPCGAQVAIDDPRAYGIYQACVDLGIPVFVNAGVPGPPLPAWPQEVMRLDAVCYDFPDLVLVTRHGCEPWTALAVKLLLKWPGLHYSTSAFAPKHYPRDVIDFANTRGADKVLFAGYFPYGLSMERVFGELPAVPFRDHVRPMFLRDNARRILGLDR